MKTLLLALLTLPLFGASIDSGSPADQYFTGGSAFTITTPGATDTTVRYGTFGYHIPLPSGAYLVTLNFQETGTITAKNQRVFSVKFGTRTVIDRLDLFAVAGLGMTSRSFVEASNGFLDIDFTYTTRSAIVSSIQIDVISTLGQVPGTAFPDGYGMSRMVDQPTQAGIACQDGDWAAGFGPASTTMGVPLYVCIAGTMRRFRADPEPWGNEAVSDLGGVLQMQTTEPTAPPVFYFRTQGGVMIGPFTFSGPGPVPIGLSVPVRIQPFPRAAAQ